MASTRNKNAKSEYALEQRTNNFINNWNTYENSSYGSPYDAAMPAVGYMPSHMCPCFFSNNAIDIESDLYGINSTNLVSEKPKTNPELKTIKTINYFDRIEMLMPKPLVIEDNQRPLL